MPKKTSEEVLEAQMPTRVLQDVQSPLLISETKANRQVSAHVQIRTLLRAYDQLGHARASSCGEAERPLEMTAACSGILVGLAFVPLGKADILQLLHP
jgi:hypothetical protein